PGENKLTDRLLANKETSERFQKILKELTTTCFTKEKLFADIDMLEKATKDGLAREKKAVEARNERKVFGLPGGMFGQAPSLRTFVEKRTASAAAQLAGTSKGYVPVMSFGGPKGGFGGPKGGFGGPMGGPGGFGGPGPGGFGPGFMLAKPIMENFD